MGKREQHAGDHPVAVIGLGRFGTAVATSLRALGHDVLVIDEDPELVQRWSHEFTQVVQADSTQADVLRQLGVDQFDRAVVGIGTDVEASLLTVLALVEIGIEEVWAKAINKQHGTILDKVGATHVVYPESAMGERVAHMVTGSMIDFMEFDDRFAIARTRAPGQVSGRTLEDSRLRSKFGVTVVGIKRRGEDFTYARPETVVEPYDELIISGTTDQIENFCASTFEK
ncbi:potassium channel family protein [Solicola sp. PLA-1-18]|uniref:potassium channel family protein n=1 Tax=Solicola sp. PLA-1-18 TaxID=3380532 RepID=UPI003B8260C2